MNLFDGLTFDGNDGVKNKQYLENLLKELRERNDSPQSTDVGTNTLLTAGLRGQIDLVKKLLKGPATPVKAPSYFGHPGLPGGGK